MAKKAAKNKQAKAKARQLAAARAAKGAAEYNGVSAAPFKLKVLVAQLAKAQSDTTQASGKAEEATAKELMNGVALAREETKAAAEAKKIADTNTANLNKETLALKGERRKIQVASVDSSDAAEKVRIFSVLVAVKLRAKRLTKESLDELKPYQRRARDAILSLPAGSDARIGLFSQYTQASRRAASLKPASNDDKAQANEDEQPDNRAQASKDKLLGTKKVKSWKMLERVMTLLGKNKDGSLPDQPGKGREGVTSLSPVSSSFTTFAVQGIAKIGSGLKSIGKSIKDNGVNTLKWIGNRLSSLTRGIMGMFRSAKNMFSSGDAGDWAAMAAIGIGILPQIVQGMLDELKKRFGEDFIIGFIKEKWESTKTAVTQWLGEFIDKALDLIQKLPEKIAKGAAYVAEKTKKGAENVSLAVKDLFTPSAAKEAEQARMKQGPSAMDKLGGLIADHSASGITPAKKLEVEKKIRDLVISSPSLYNDSTVIANLEKRGIKIDAKLAQTTNNTSTATASPTSVNNSTSTVGGSPGAAVTGGGGNAVTASPAAGGGGASEAPVTATPPTPQAKSTDDGGDSGSSTPKTGGLSNSSVPDNAAPESLFFMNLASMGAA